jgi:hypothetical protein
MTRSFKPWILIAIVLGWTTSGVLHTQEQGLEAPAAPDEATVSAVVFAQIEDCARAAGDGFTFAPGTSPGEVKESVRSRLNECVAQAIQWAREQGHADETGALIAPSRDELDSLNRKIDELFNTNIATAVARHESAAHATEPEPLPAISSMPSDNAEPEPIAAAPDTTRSAPLPTAIVLGALTLLALGNVVRKKATASRNLAAAEEQRKRNLEDLGKAAVETMRSQGLEQAAKELEAKAYELYFQAGGEELHSQTNQMIRSRVAEYRQSIVAELTSRFPDMDGPGRSHVLALVESGVEHRLKLARKSGADRAFDEERNQRRTEATASLEETCARLYPQLAELIDSGDRDALGERISELVEEICALMECESLEEVRDLITGPNTTKLLDALIELHEELREEAADADTQYEDIEDANDIDADDERNRAQEARLARLEREMEQARRKHEDAESDRDRKQRNERDRLERERRQQDARRLSNERDAARERQRRATRFEVVELSTFGTERVHGLDYSGLANAIRSASRIRMNSTTRAVFVRDKNGITVWSR